MQCLPSLRHMNGSLLFTVFSLIFFGLINSAQASLFDDILQALKNMIDCSSCHATLVTLQTAAFQGDDTFNSVFIQLCDALKLADPDVCQGTLSTTGPIIAHDLRSINASDQTAGRLCDALFGFCSSNVSTPFTVPLPPPKANNAPPAPPSERREPFQVVHISDVHIDREYTVGAEANCTKTICCRNFPDQARHNITEPAEPNGNHNCDSPISLADSMLEAVNDINPKFVVFTGDVVDHANWLSNQLDVTNDLEEFNADLLLKVNTQVFPSLGNHDSSPVNAFARKTSMTANDSQWVFDLESAGWEQWIANQASDQVQHDSGSYAALVPETNLIILSVNTQYWYKQNFWLYDSDEFQPDPNDVLAFMVGQLQAAEDAGQKVWVIGHIPLGSEDIMEDQSNYYDQILQRYKDTIVGQFFGHSHKDQFQIAYSNYNEQTAANAVSAALIGPALTPTSGNPAFKVYDVDPDTFSVMNMRVIFSNTSDPSFQVEPKWELLYDARETYGPLVGLPDDSELTPAFWHNLTKVFEKNNTAFQLYNTFLSRGSLVKACDEACKSNTICDQRAFRSENNCDTPSGGVSLGRRDIGSSFSFVDDECEGSGIRSLLYEMRAKLQT